MKTYILIDRSGSMALGWTETMGAMNTFIGGLKQKTKIFMAAFDNTNPFDVVYDGKCKDWDTKAMGQFLPRGMTPLYDAVLRLGGKIAGDKPTKAQIVIITDGEENASKEANVNVARKLVAKWEKKGFDVVFIGASFEGAANQAAAMGISAGKTVNMGSHDTYVGTMSAMSTRNTSYASGVTQSMDDLDDDIRDAADGE